MNTQPMITTLHLTRKAIIYIRQSTPHQVISHQESLRLQYALKQRALSLGWNEKNIEIIDADLGLSGKAIRHRKGFKDMLSKVTLGEVGIIFSWEVMRLCRNCSDWYPLLDICSYKKCLIADTDGIYDPGTPNGRLLLGIKGQLSELELHVLRNRMTAGLLNKAQRGELALTLPGGLIRDKQGLVHKDPHQGVQKSLDMVFSNFLRLRSASKVLHYFNTQDLRIPRRNQFGDVIWKKPTISAILSILKNPAYAGAFVYGKTQTIRQEVTGEKTSVRRLPMDQWKIVVKDKYPPYIKWETFEKIQAMLKDNYAEYDRNKSRGVPKEGAALLHGIIYCGECGHKMVVQYKNGTRYLCNYLRQQYRVPVCQYIPASPVDTKVVGAFFEALSVAEIDAYAQALEKQKQIEQEQDLAHQQQLQRLRYQATLAQRQFDKVDPDNRLVAAELERRWENALSALKEAEESYEQRKKDRHVPHLPLELEKVFKSIGQKLPEIWNTSILSTSIKKALLRSLIDKVIIHRSCSDQVRIRIVWKGGATTALMIQINVGSFAALSCAEQIEKLILQLESEGFSDEDIAQQLTDQGYRSPMREHFLPSTVKSIRLKHRVLKDHSQSHPRQIPGYLTVSQIAQRLQVPPSWIYDRIRKGCIQIGKDLKTNLYLFPNETATLALFHKLKRGRIKMVQF
jgi:DNA invertase Pin-like site-specific DNA recombinase